MASKLEELMKQAPSLPVEPDIASMRTAVPAFTPEAAEDLQRFVDHYDASTFDGDMATRTARAGRRRV